MHNTCNTLETAFYRSQQKHLQTCFWLLIKYSFCFSETNFKSLLFVSGFQLLAFGQKAKAKAKTKQGLNH